MQIARGRAQLDALCAHLGIADSAHLPKMFRALLPCAATQPGAVALASSALELHHVNGLFWNAMEGFVMRLATGREVVAAVVQVSLHI